MSKIVKLPPSSEHGEPLSLEYFDAHHASFSGRIIAHLGKSPFFRPKLKKDGSPSDKDMLTVAATVIAVSDSHIEKLERRAQVLNGPMFQPASSPTDSEVPHDEEAKEASWFAKYLTLRNFISAAIVVVAAIWAAFTWYTADKNTQLTIYKDKYDASEKEKASIEADIAHWKKEAEDYRKEEEAKDAEAQKQRGRADQLQKDLDAERVQSKQLVEALKKAPNSGGSAVPAGSTK